jgi:hypothetical protein
MTEFLTPGVTAPSFRLTAVYTNRPITPAQYRSRPVLLTFSDHQTAYSTQTLVKGVRRQYDDPRQLMILNVVDMRAVPRLMRGVARRIMDRLYEQVAKEIPAQYDPQDHLIILPDWDGAACQAYRVPDISRHLALVFLDRENRVYRSYYGPDSQETAVRQSASLIARQAS